MFAVLYRIVKKTHLPYFIDDTPDKKTCNQLNILEAMLMGKNRILILGGYGGVGKALSRLILKEFDLELIIGGRRKDQAEKFVNILSQEYPDSTILAQYADVTDEKSLVAAFKGVKLIIVTATTPKHTKQVAQAAIASKCDYLDILVQPDVISTLQSLEPQIDASGLTFITQAGFHPGLPAVFIRHAAKFFDQYDKSVIAVAINARFEKPESTHEILHVICEDSAEIFESGRWRKAVYKDAIKIDFGRKFGIKTCYALQMEEIKPLPCLLGIKEAGVYVAGFNWFVDYIVFPIILLFNKIKKGSGRNFLGKLIYWGVNTFSSSNQGVAFILEAEGKKDGKALNVKLYAEHEDALFFTAAPVIACLKQFFSGDIKPGLCLMGNAVDNESLISEIKTLGVNIQTEIKNIH
ncbi:MAG: KR domain-containing protein [Desulfobacteraceae bacterium]|nr:KR domain-containing protein [Desulfobacteraceae bacterium]